MNEQSAARPVLPVPKTNGCFTYWPSLALGDRSRDFTACAETITFLFETSRETYDV